MSGPPIRSDIGSPVNCCAIEDDVSAINFSCLILLFRQPKNEPPFFYSSVKSEPLAVPFSH